MLEKNILMAEREKMISNETLLSNKRECTMHTHNMHKSQNNIVE